MESLGYEVAAAENGEEAIEEYRRGRETAQPFAAVILDLTIKGGMGGAKTLEELKKIDPDVRALVSSGYSDKAVMSEYKERGFAGVLPKPYRIGKMSRVLAELLGEDQESKNDEKGN